MSIRGLQKKQLAEGRIDEQIFRDLTGAEDAPSSQESRHIDCYWQGFSVDVKGRKRSHKDGIVLVEFKNVSGKDGWAVKGPDLIAYMFQKEFVVVKREDLYKMAQKRTIEHATDNGTHVFRANGTSGQQGLYKLCGRAGRKDVFTYVTKEDLLGLTNVKVQIN